MHQSAVQYLQPAVRKVLGCERPDFFEGSLLRIEQRSSCSRLLNGVDLGFEEASVLPHFYLDDRGYAIGAAKIEAAVSSKISQAVGNEPIPIYLY